MRNDLDEILESFIQWRLRGTPFIELDAESKLICMSEIATFCWHNDALVTQLIMQANTYAVGMMLAAYARKNGGEGFWTLGEGWNELDEYCKQWFPQFEIVAGKTGARIGHIREVIVP